MGSSLFSDYGQVLERSLLMYLVSGLVTVSLLTSEHKWWVI